MTQLEPDREQMERFVSDLFRHALGEDGFVTVRAFYDNEGETKPFRIQGVPVNAGFRSLIDVAEDIARRSANEPKRVVFCPPLGLFNNGERAKRKTSLPVSRFRSSWTHIHRRLAKLSKACSAQRPSSCSPAACGRTETGRSSPSFICTGGCADPLKAPSWRR